MDDTMKDCILRLYRSAVNVGDEWEPGLSGITSPGLVFWGVSDTACPVEFADRLARDTRARRVLKFDVGRWFPLQRPNEEIRERMSGNLCRCAAYANMVPAIMQVAQQAQEALQIQQVGKEAQR